MTHGFCTLSKSLSRRTMANDATKIAKYTTEIITSFLMQSVQRYPVGNSTVRLTSIAPYNPVHVKYRALSQTCH